MFLLLFMYHSRQNHHLTHFCIILICFTRYTKGTSDYADKWVQAAFEGGKTSFVNGNADFSQYTMEGREQIIKKGTAYMNVFMYVYREFVDALDDCKRDCIDCNDDPVHAWDEGVCFYTGSLPSHVPSSLHVSFTPKSSSHSFLHHPHLFYSIHQRNIRLC